MSYCTDIRDEIYTRILSKKTALGFSLNSFSLQKTWRPRLETEELFQDYPNGILYVVGGTLGDREAISRDNTVNVEVSVKLGFQAPLTDPDTLTGVDALTDLIDELDDVCRNDVHNNSEYSYFRTEFLKDENGVPFDFVVIDTLSTFESYLTVYYHLPIPRG